MHSMSTSAQVTKVCKAAALQLVSLHMQREAMELQAQALTQGQLQQKQLSAMQAEGAQEQTRQVGPLLVQQLLGKAVDLAEKASRMEAKAVQRAQVGTSSLE